MQSCTYLNIQGIQEFAHAIISHMEHLNKSHQVTGKIFGMYTVNVFNMHAHCIYM